MISVCNPLMATVFEHLFMFLTTLTSSGSRPFDDLLGPTERFLLRGRAHLFRVPALSLETASESRSLVMFFSTVTHSTVLWSQFHQSASPSNYFCQVSHDTMSLSPVLIPGFHFLQASAHALFLLALYLMDKKHALKFLIHHCKIISNNLKLKRFVPPPEACIFLRTPNVLLCFSSLVYMSLLTEVG